jgi:3(or 17)beta-hydroxysteroid dehydrogenase
MTGRVQNKVALVTGGAGGVGQATVRLLLAEGARVAFTDVDEAAGQRLHAEWSAEFAAEPGGTLAADQGPGGRVRFWRQDVARAEDWSRVMAELEQSWGPPDIVINNAGILIAGDIENGSVEDFRRIMQVNAESVFLGTQAAVRAMKARGGSIVNMASVSSWMPIDGYAAYGASKAAVGAITRSAALHCRKQKLRIRVNSLHPDGIWTPMTQSQAPGVPAKFMLFDPVKNPAGRACLPEQIASVLLFLASDESSAINGAEIRADGAILGVGL